MPIPTSLPPIFYHHFLKPLPYTQTLALQERLHALQLAKRRLGSHKDILLLLEHRPVYTAGRRQTEADTRDERTRLTQLGADFVIATRGGQMTYHGPGQLVGYPLLDLGRYSPAMGARDYVCRMQNFLKAHLRSVHGIESASSEHTGVFLDSRTKIGSIGVQVRHRLTSHGFAFNVTKEPLAWFDKIVACGLDDVGAGCVQGRTQREGDVSVGREVAGVVQAFGDGYEREMVGIKESDDGEVWDAIAEMENEAERAGECARAPCLL